MFQVNQSAVVSEGPYLSGCSCFVIWEAILTVPCLTILCGHVQTPIYIRAGSISSVIVLLSDNSCMNPLPCALHNIFKVTIMSPDVTESQWHIIGLLQDGKCEIIIQHLQLTTTHCFAITQLMLLKAITACPWHHFSSLRQSIQP